MRIFLFVEIFSGKFLTVWLFFQITLQVAKQFERKVFTNKVFERKVLFLWFTTNKMLLSRMSQALQFSNRKLIRRIFPNDQEGIPVETVDMLREHELFDKSIYTNKEQLRAINHILAGTSKEYPYLVFGPPGTGKTVAVAEAIKQVYAKIPGSTIIVTAQSNCAVDLLAERLVQHVDLGRMDELYIWLMFQ